MRVLRTQFPRFLLFDQIVDQCLGSFERDSFHKQLVHLLLGDIVSDVLAKMRLERERARLRQRLIFQVFQILSSEHSDV